MNTEQGVDMDGVTAWQELLADQDRADVLDLARMMQQAPTEGLGAKLGAVVDLTLGVLLADPSPHDVRQFADLLLPLAQRAVTDSDATYVAGRGVVAASTLLAGLGVDEPPANTPAEQAATWLPSAAAAVESLQDYDRHDWALICAAYGFDESVSQFTDVGLAGRLAEGIAATAGIEDVNPAWTSFVADFPAALETGSVRMSCLLHAGYAVYTRFGGHRPNQVLDAIRDFIRAGMEG
jgi:hypothetical protein